MGERGVGLGLNSVRRSTIARTTLNDPRDGEASLKKDTTLTRFQLRGQDFARCLLMFFFR